MSEIHSPRAPTQPKSARKMKTPTSKRTPRNSSEINPPRSARNSETDSVTSERSYTDDLTARPSRAYEHTGQQTPTPSSLELSTKFTEKSPIHTKQSDETSLESEVARQQQRKPPRDPNAPLEADFLKATEETSASPHYAELVSRDTDATLTDSDVWAYKLENAIAANPAVRFYILLFISLVSCIVLAMIWVGVAGGDDDHEATNDPASALFMAFQVLITGGYDSSIQETSQRLAFFVTILVGVSIVSILIGLISDTVNEYMEDLSSGSSKVVEDGHTLILGWNESTTRVVCQIAFLRRIYLMQNETWSARLFPWTRTVPSSPVSAAPIVIMNDTQEKEEMEEMVRDAFASRNINPKRTKIGRDVVFRKGDPTDNHDLVRVAAHKAASIMVMMTVADREGLDISEGVNENSGSIRTVLALRNLVFSNGNPMETFPKGLRVVVQLSSACPYLEASAFVTPWGKPCLFAQDVGKSVNMLLFKCSSDPGLANVLIQLMGFEGTAIKCRSASQLCAGPDSERGWFVGKTMGHALLHHGWSNAQLIGSDDDKIGEFDFEGDNDGHYNQPGSPGVMGDPERIVLASDTMIFVCDSSTPTPGGASKVAKYESEAKPFLANATTSRAPVGADANKAQHMLLCGWRAEWTKQPERFKDRLNDVKKGMPPGSVVTCANLMDSEDFAAFMTSPKVGFKAVSSPNERMRYSGYDGALCIDHHCGDPAHFVGMKELFGSCPEAINTALVLGSMVTIDLPGSARDARVLSILLILRKLASDAGWKGMHAIAENEQDQTAMLAVCPASANKSGLPDFVNTQQIIARSLTMNLAYPQIQDAVSEIFMPAGLGIEFIASQHLGLVGNKVSYGAMLHVVTSTYQGRGIPIGYMLGPKMVLGPDQKEVIEWTNDHRVICFVRRGVGSGGVGSSAADV